MVARSAAFSDHGKVWVERKRIAEFERRTPFCTRGSNFQSSLYMHVTSHEMGASLLVWRKESASKVFRNPDGTVFRVSVFRPFTIQNNEAPYFSMILINREWALLILNEFRSESCSSDSSHILSTVIKEQDPKFLPRTSSLLCCTHIMSGVPFFPIDEIFPTEKTLCPRKTKFCLLHEPKTSLKSSQVYGGLMYNKQIAKVYPGSML